MKTLFSNNITTYFFALAMCFIGDHALSQSMQNRYFSDVLVEWDTRTIQSDKVCKECLDSTANFILFGLIIFFLIEIWNAVIFHSLIEKKRRFWVVLTIIY